MLFTLQQIQSQFVMFARNSKHSSQKQNSGFEDPQFMRNSSVVDMLVESLQTSSTRQRRPEQVQQSKPQNIFKLVSNHLNNSEMESSQQSQQSQQRGLFSKKRPSIVEPEKQQLFKKQPQEEEARLDFGDLLQQSERRFFAQLKKQEDSCESVKQEMRKSFKLLVEQLNTKFMTIDRRMVELNEQNMVTSSGLDLFKQITEQRTEELVGRLDSAKLDKMEQSGYDLDLGASREIANRQFTESMEARYKEQLTDVVSQIARLREEIRSHQLKQQQAVVVPMQTMLQTSSKEEIQQLKDYFENCLKQRDKVLEPKLTEFDRVLRIHDESISKINGEFQRVINQHLNPRIFKLEEFMKKPVEDPTSKKALEDIVKFKDDLEERLKNSRILQLRKPTSQQNSVLSKMGSINMGDTYFIDENRYLMDSQGIYLTDENNARIKIEQNQLCFLAANGIAVNN